MSDLMDDLNYDFEYNMFLVKALLPNLENPSDKEHVIRWVRALAAAHGNIDEMRLRNDFMYFLVLATRKGVLHAPFCDLPPTVPLSEATHLLPLGGEAATEAPELRSGAAPELYARSPDGGAFLASQPTPRAGAFCYMAVVAKPTD